MLHTGLILVFDTSPLPTLTSVTTSTTGCQSITSNIDLYENVNDRGNFCAGLMVHKRETIATEIVLISLDSFKDIIPGINNCVRIESQVKESWILSKCTSIALFRWCTTVRSTSCCVVVATGTQVQAVTRPPARSSSTPW